MQQTRDGRLTFELTRPVTSWGLTSDYREFHLPPHALADCIDSVIWMSANGGEFELSRVDVAHQSRYDQPNDSGTPSMYVLLDGRIRLIPAPNPQTGSIRYVYQRRHGDLCAETQKCTIASVASLSAGAACSITMSSDLASGMVAGAWVDLISPRYPYRLELPDVRITSANTGTDTLTLDLPYATLNAVSPTTLVAVHSGETPYVHLPLELRQSFTDYVAAAIVRQLGDEALANTYERSAQEGLGRALGMLSPRTKGTRLKLVNPYSLFRGGASRRNRGGGETW